MNNNIVKLASELLFASLNDNNLSRSQLTDVLGYTSKTSIDRIAQENAGERALIEFYDRMSAHPELFRKEYSKQMFRQISSILGKDSVHEWLLLFKNEAETLPPVMVRSEPNGTTCSFVDAYKGCQDIRFYVHGCISPSFIESLHLLISNTFPTSSCHCYQYLRLSDTTLHLSKAIRCLYPILFSPYYDGYIYNDSHDQDDIHFILPYNCVLVIFTGPDGIEHADCLVFDNATLCRRMSLQAPLAVHRLVQDELRQKTLEPIINNILSKLKSNYADYTEYCEDLERDHAVYQYKLDFGLEQIDPALTFKALHEGPFFTLPDCEELFNALKPGHVRRYENNCYKAEEQIHVFKESAIRAFAETGKMSDHFWGLRPYTIPERISILGNIIRRVDTESDYRVFLLDNEEGFTDSEITLYEGAGLSIIKPHTSYSLDEGHSETIIQSPDFCASFKHFFTRELIPGYAMDQKASLKCLKSILSDLKKRNR